MDHDEGHRQAGVDSYRQLSREGAAEVIDLWTQALESRAEALHPHSTPTPDGEAGEERPDKRTGEDTAAAAPSSPAGRKKSAASEGLLSTSDRAAAGPAAGSGSPAAGPPSQDHVHDWQPAPTAAMAKKGWRVCAICRKALGPGEQG
jgi:hypothetical protein